MTPFPGRIVTYRCPTHGWSMSPDVVVKRAERNGDCRYKGGGCYAVGMVTYRGKEAAAEAVVRIHGVPADNSPLYLERIERQKNCDHTVTMTEIHNTPGAYRRKTWCSTCGKMLNNQDTPLTSG